MTNDHPDYFKDGDPSKPLFRHDPDADATRVLPTGGDDDTRVMPGESADADSSRDTVSEDAVGTAPAQDSSAEAADDESADVDAASTAPKRRKTTLVLIGLGVAALLLGGVYVGGHIAAGDKTPRNATVAGVPIGGMSIAAATEKLETELADEAAAPLSVKVGEENAEIKPAEAGLSVDYAQSVLNSGAGSSWDPRQIWLVLSGGSETEPVIVADQAKLDAAAAKLSKLNTEASNASVAYDGTKVKLKKAVSAVVVDELGTATAMREAYLTTNELDAVAAVTDADITTAEAQTTIDTMAEPAVSGKVKVKVGKRTFAVTPKMIAKATTFEPKDGTLALVLDADKLYKAARSEIDGLGLDKGRDARIVLRNGKPTIVASVDGIGIKPKDLASQVETVLTKTEGRSVKVKATEKAAEFSTADAKKAGVKRVIAEFTTYFPYAEYRNHNLTQAASSINNTYVAPGKEFSLNRTLGERTAANGYVDGYIIKGSKFVKEPGGGVSQSATTTFNAAFFAGMTDVEHHPHTLYIDRYPAGREATVYYGSLDMRFRNDTKYGVLMQAYVNKAAPGGRGSITVRVWSSKTYTSIKSSELARSNFTSAPTIREKGSDCEAQSAVQGFDVNYSRLFYKGSEVVKREPFHWRYAPTPQIICE